MIAYLLLALIVGPFQLQGVIPRKIPPVFGMSEVLQKHALWLSSNGREGAKADLRNLSLEGGEGPTILTGVDLRQADLRGSTMRDTDFSKANLQDARFDQTNLRWSDFENADLRRANFSHANLQSVDLKGANLDQADLDQADFSGADLSTAQCVQREQLSRAVTDESTRLPMFEDCSTRRQRN